MPDPSEQDNRPPGPARDPGGGGPPAWMGLMGMGFEFLACFCVVGGIGWLIDRRLHSFPWLTLIGAAVGFAVGLTVLIRAGKNAFKD
jgi:hypothetical protein